MAKTSYSWKEAPFRRVFRLITSPVPLALIFVVTLISIGILFYYYNRYTQIIDAGLRGDIFVRSSGIYAAPLTLHAGTGMRLSELIGHLRAVGYVDQTTAQNEKRGRFLVQGNAIEIYPGSDTIIDGARAFHSLRVVFGRSGNTIQSITDLDLRQRVGEAQIEPELISSIINPEREKRKIIEYKDLPQHLVDAIISIEDRQFFEHPGINWRGILRALIRDYQIGEIREGGSSITQQLVKNFFLKPERTWKRKLSEAYMSILLEQRLTKQEIMAMYCNQIYLGQRGGFSINGFGQAARAYFGKDVSNLALDESALLAGVIRSPNYYSPYSNADRALERRNKAIEMMVEAGKLSRMDAEQAKRQPLGVVGKSFGIDASDAPYFVDFLMRQLEAQYGEGAQSLRSLRVYSTIDLDLQRAAYQAVAKNMLEVDKRFARRRGGTAGLQAALVAMNAKTGEILAMVGGRDYASSQLNRATDARRQPGSVFKPFVYAAALEQSASGFGPQITLASTYMDEPRTFEFEGKRYEPGNFGDQYEMRPMTVRDALVNSKNVITVQIAQQVGLTEVQRLAQKAGLTSVPPYPSMALGVGEATPLQMASAYTAFANGGRRAGPIAIRRVTTKDGATHFESRVETNEVMSPQVSYILTTIMQEVLDRGTGTRVRQMGFRATAAGKTGSSRDAWFAGYTPNIVCVVWVGFDDNSDIGLTGGVIAAPIWADFMIRALRLRPEYAGQFRPPEEGIVSYDIDPATGDNIQNGSPNVRHELFIEGTQPGAQPRPGSIPPGAEYPSVPIDPENPRPAPTPRPGGEAMLTGTSNDSFIPLPPEARRRAEPSRPQQQPPAKEGNQNPSFLRRLADAVGVTTIVGSGPKPTPTPWSSAGSRTTPPPIGAPPRYQTPNSANESRPRRVESEKRKPENTGPRILTPAPPTAESSPQTGGFVLEVCSVSHLLPVRGICNTTIRQRYQLGREPTTFCSAEKHRK